jgi:hypothetical protein
MTLRREIALRALTGCGALLLAAGCATTCGPGTVETDGGGWRVERDESGGLKVVDKICLPISPISDCTDYQMIEQDGGGWRRERDGGGWRIDRDGGGWRRERDAPQHPGYDDDDDTDSIVYVPSGVCRIGVEPPPEIPPPIEFRLPAKQPQSAPTHQGS